MDAVLLDIWGCAKCKRHETPVVKDFGEAGQSTVCPNCGGEDIFPLNDGGWSEGTMQRITAIPCTPVSGYPCVGCGRGGGTHSERGACELCERGAVAFPESVKKWRVRP